MKKGLFLFVLTVLALSAFPGRIPAQTGEGEKGVESGKIAALTPEKAFGRLPLAFVENRGQVAKPVKYVLRGPRGSVFFTPAEVVFEVMERGPEKKTEGRPEAVRPEVTESEQEKPAPGGTESTPGKTEEEKSSVRGAVVRMKFIRARAKVELTGENELPGRVNVLKGKDPASWKTDIRRFGRVVYRGLYPGVDLVYSGEQRKLDWSLVVDSPKRLRKLRFQYQGVDSLQIDGDGNLLLQTAVGVIQEFSPRITVKGEEKPFSGRFVLLKKNRIGIELAPGKNQQPENQVPSATEDQSKKD